MGADWWDSVRHRNVVEIPQKFLGVTSGSTTVMEAEERPQKMRKLSHDEGSPLDASDLSFAESAPPEHPLNHASTGEIVPQTATADEDALEGADGEDKATAKGNTANMKTTISTSENPPKLSKNQLKKLKKQEQWEASRDYRKAKRKEKTAERKARKRATREEEEQRKKTQNVDGTSVATVKSQQQYKGRSTLLPVTLVLDCGFDDLMNDKEIISLASQLTRCYADNYRAKYRAHLVASSFGGKLKKRFDTVLERHYENWRGVRFLDDDFAEASRRAEEWMRTAGGGRLKGIFEEIENGAGDSGENNDEQSKGEGKLDGEVIYLTSDSPNTLERLKPYSTYIIGGLVDKNRHKGICYQTAMDKGIKTAKLPIGDYMQMQSRFVLATNHVCEIMLRWLECGDWGESFVKVMPKRKGGILKAKNENENLADGLAPVSVADGQGEDEESSHEVEDDDDEGTAGPHDSVSSS